LKGTYNTALNFNDNVDLTDPILSRFDILAVVKDEVNEEQDDALATFVINSHMKNHPEVAKILNIDQQQMDNRGPEGEAERIETEQRLKDTLLNEDKIKISNND
jgi:DNA replication licensing factor MCM2